MALETYLLYLIAIGAFFATPPDTSQLLMVSNSIRHGLGRSGFTVLGDLTANCLQMLAAAFGLAAVIATSAGAFQWIKWIGVAYLIWIGVGLILSKDTQRGTVVASSSAGASRLFGQGFITSMANPFAVIFFAALFPQFIDPALAILPQLLILGGTYLVVDGILLLAWGWLGLRAADRIRNFSFGLVNRLCGVLMIGAAALLAMRDFEPERR